MILKTEHATVDHTETFTALIIEPDDPGKPLDLMDIKKIYAAFFRQWLHSQIDEMSDDGVIKLGYRLAEMQTTIPL